MSDHPRYQRTDPLEHVDSILEFLTILKLRVQNEGRTSTIMNPEKIAMISMSFVSCSIGISPCVWLGIQLYNQVACLTANSHNAKMSAPYSDQWSETCIMMVHIIYIIVWISSSALAFWWWAPIPEKLQDWYFLVQSTWKTSAAKTPLLLQMCLISA